MKIQNCDASKAQPCDPRSRHITAHSQYSNSFQTNLNISNWAWLRINLKAYITYIQVRIVEPTSAGAMRNHGCNNNKAWTHYLWDDRRKTLTTMSLHPCTISLIYIFSFTDYSMIKQQSHILITWYNPWGVSVWRKLHKSLIHWPKCSQHPIRYFILRILC